MPEVFISYARDDTTAARLIADHLERAGISVLLDDASIVAGQVWSEKIKSDLARASAVLVLLSSHSQRSTFVDDEVQAAIESKKRVVPVLLDDEATQNWLWPLLATRNSVRLDLQSGHWRDQLSQLADALGGVSNGGALRADASAPAASGYTFSVWKALALAAVSAAIGALAGYLAR